jgi:hypothetical protein
MHIWFINMTATEVEAVRRWVARPQRALMAPLR